MSSLFAVLLVVLDELRDHFLYGTCDHIVGDAVDGGIRIDVDADYDAAVLHSCDMLDLSADSTGDIDFRMHRNTGLADLAVMVAESRVHGCAAGADLGVQHFRKFEKHVETFLAAHSVTTGNHDGSTLKIVLGLLHVMVEHLDDTTTAYYQNCGFDPTGTYPKIYRKFIADMYAAQSLADIREGYRAACEGFGSVTLAKPADPIRIGIIGDYYTVMDPFSNLELEQKLADMGVEVHRLMNITNDMLRGGGKNKQAKIREYSEYSMGASSTADIWQAQNFAERGFDGVIQVKSAGCMPETDIMPVLANLSREYRMPILYLTYDSQTSDVGLMTRLEAFYDMVEMRKKVNR